MVIIEHLLHYNDHLLARDTNTLELIVLHCTELPTLQMTREYGEGILYTDSRTGNSGHYYIDRDGQVYRYIKDDRIAHHVVGHNERSIGIEVVNTGRYPNWYFSNNQIPIEPYKDEQITSVRNLLRWLKDRYPQIQRIARHSDLDVQLMPAEDDPDVQIRRKIDPGPLFPWDEIQAWWASLLS